MIFFFNISGFSPRFVTKQPGTKSAIGFDNSNDDDENGSDANGSDANGSDENGSDEKSIYNSPKFLDVAMNFVEIVDQAVNMLGRYLNTRTGIVVELGDTHAEEYGIKPTFYPILKIALLEQLEEMLGVEVFTRDTKACWIQFYDALAMDMASASREKSSKTNADVSKSATHTSFGHNYAALAMDIALASMEMDSK